MYKQKPDTAKAAIIAYLRTIPGCYVRTMDRTAGFDCLVCYNGQVYIVEIKTVTKPKTRAQLETMLTNNERHTMELVQSAGCRYHIVTCPAEAAGALNIPYQAS